MSKGKKFPILIQWLERVFNIQGKETYEESLNTEFEKPDRAGLGRERQP